MSYLALYRQYRPRVFSEVIGQEHVTSTLSNILTSGNIGHAYLFTGSRGTGKTTVAKIFARALNCLHPLADGSPCGECERCKLENNLDIQEIDAASNNGVDEVRALKEQIAFQSLNGGTKVYIVDEVHMLSPEAFNALLKTLEEPPAGTVFILATTDVQKVPATILSRCMRFDFRLIGTDKLAALVRDVYAKVGQTASDDAVRRIAIAGAGSARDTLSIADMCMSYAPKGISYDDVLTVIGAADPTVIAAVAEDILACRAGDALEKIGGLVDKGKSPAVIAKDVRAFLRDVGVAVATEAPEKLLVLPAEQLNAVKRLAKKATASRIVYDIDVLSGVESDLRFGLSPRVVLESAVLKCCLPVGKDEGALLAQIGALEARISELEERLRRR